jgi:hypothetical protein
MTSKGLVAGLIVLGAGLAAPVPARAESHIAVWIHGGHDSRPYGYGDGYDNGYASADSYRLGYSRGFQDGFHEGKDDGEDHDSYDFWREKRYRNADSGYHSEYGPKWEYQRGYRSGYESGYRRAYAQACRYRDGRDYGYAREHRRYGDRDDGDRGDRGYEDDYRH